MQFFRTFISKLPIALRLLMLYSIASLLLFPFYKGGFNALVSAVFARLLLFMVPIFVLHFTEKRVHFKNKTNLFLHFFGFAMLGFFYSETAQLNTLFYPLHDNFFIQLDQKIFGFQPAIEFSKRFNSYFFNELMCFSYISYYFLFIGTPFLIYWLSPKKFEKTSFILMFSFVSYYVFFILFPVAGPQFAFHPPDSDLAQAGILRSLLTVIHQIGEGPTAAFPSSHVGIVVICLMLIFQNSKVWFYALIPLILMLCLSTVYIKAHYFVDVIGGLISAPILYFAGQKIWNIIHHKK